MERAVKRVKIADEEARSKKNKDKTGTTSKPNEEDSAALYFLTEEEYMEMMVMIATIRVKMLLLMDM